MIYQSLSLAPYPTLSPSPLLCKSKPTQFIFIGRSYSVSVSTLCLNLITSLSNDIPISLFGTLSYSVSITTFVQIQTNTVHIYWEVIFCLCLHLCLNLITSLKMTHKPLFGTLSYSVSISTFVQIPNQLNSYLQRWGWRVIICTLCPSAYFV